MYIIFINKNIFFMLIFSLFVYGKEYVDIPLYLPKTQVDDGVVAFLNDQDSLIGKYTNGVVQKSIVRDILGRQSRGTTTYILRNELFRETENICWYSRPISTK